MYELMVVGKVSSADELFKKVEKMIKDANASSVTSVKMGKKTLAFPINKQTEAEYFLFNFEAAGEAISGISDALRLDQEAVLRYMILATKAAKPSKVSKTPKVEAKQVEESQEPKVEKKVTATVKVAAKSDKVKT